MEQPFIYNVRGTLLGGGAAEILTLTISNDADFFLQEIRTVGTNNLRVMIRQTNGTLFSSIAFNAAIIGAGQNALKFMKPFQLPKNTQLEITLDNQTGGALTTAGEVHLIGWKA